MPSRLIEDIKHFIVLSTWFWSGDEGQPGFIGELKDPHNNFILTTFRFVVSSVLNDEEKVRVFIYGIEPFGQNYNENAEVDDNKEKNFSSLDDFTEWFYYRFGNSCLKSSLHPDYQEVDEELF